MILLTKILIGCGLALVSVGTAWWAKTSKSQSEDKPLLIDTRKNK